jgi:hypothetical protein
MIKQLKRLARNIWTAQPHTLPSMVTRHGPWNGSGHTYRGDRSVSPQLAKLAKFPVPANDLHTYSG